MWTRRVKLYVIKDVRLGRVALRFNYVGFCLMAHKDQHFIVFTQRGLWHVETPSEFLMWSGSLSTLLTIFKAILTLILVVGHLETPMPQSPTLTLWSICLWNWENISTCIMRNLSHNDPTQPIPPMPVTKTITKIKIDFFGALFRHLEAIYAKN